MKRQNPVFLSDFERKNGGEGGRRPPEPSPFPFLKWIAGFVFLLSLVAMTCAGLLYADLLALRARTQPETWAAYLATEEGPPQAGYIAISVLIGLSLAAIAAIVYVFAAVSDVLFRQSTKPEARRRRGRIAPHGQQEERG